MQKSLSSASVLVLPTFCFLILSAIASGDFGCSIQLPNAPPGFAVDKQQPFVGLRVGSSEYIHGPQRMMLRLRGGKDEENVLRDIRQSILNSPILAPGAEGEGAGVSLNRTALEAAAERLNISRVAATSKFGISLPLLFDNFEQEVNFWAVLSLLSIGSGWHEALPHKYGAEGYPHRDTITYGLTSLHMGGHSLDANDMAGLQAFALSQAFNVPITKEHRIDGGPIRQDVPSDYMPLVDMWLGTLNKVGAELLARGFSSLGAFILSTGLHAHSAPSTPPPPSAFSASLLVQRLVKVFEVLQDEADGVLFHRRAQVLTHELHLRFRHRDERLDFGDVGELSLGSDAETGVWLLEKGVLQLTPALAAKVEAGKALKHGSPEEVALRLAAARGTLMLSQHLSSLHPDQDVTCADAAKFMDYLSKLRHRYNVKHNEATAAAADGKSEPEPRISELPDDADTTMEAAEESGLQRQVLFVCKDSPHY